LEGGFTRSILGFVQCLRDATVAAAEPHGAVVVTETDTAVDEAGAIEAKVEPTETDVAPPVLALASPGTECRHYGLRVCEDS
jgi:hypothetical protein